MGANPGRAAPWLGLLFGAVLGCGDVGLTAVPRHDAPVQVEVRGQTVPCGEAPGIEFMEAELFSAAGGSVDEDVVVDCTASEVRLGTGLVPGAYRLEVEAFGRLQGGPQRRLYSASRRFTAPLAEPLTLYLVPEVAFFEVHWSFEDAGAADSLCDTEGARVQLDLFGLETGFEKTLAVPCAPRSHRLREPLPLDTYRLEVKAQESDGRTRFVRVEERVLVAGANRYDAVLRPAEPAMELDWEFAVGAERFRACDAVGVSSLHLRVWPAGDPARVPLQSDLSCTQARPVPIRDKLPMEEGPFWLEVSAEGDHAFFSEVEVDPARESETIYAHLVAHGEAWLTWTFAAGCEPEGRSQIEVTVRSLQADPDPRELEEPTLGPDGQGLWFGPLPYGRYVVVLRQDNGCSARGERVIDATDQDWAPLELAP